jgi:glucose-6-phosphate 1-dehydrogenase
MDHEEYIKRVRSYIKTPTKDMEKQLEDFCGLCTYVSGQYDKDESFQNLDSHLKDLEKDRPEAHRLFYMALPPSVFTIVSQHLKRCCYPTNGIARVVVSCVGVVLRKPSLTISFIGREAVRQGPCQLPRAAEVAGAGLVRG